MEPSPRIPANPCGTDCALIVDYFCWASAQARAEGLADYHIEAAVEHPAMRRILLDVIHGESAVTLVKRYAALATSPEGSIERLIYEGALLIHEGCNREIIRQKLPVR